MNNRTRTWRARGRATALALALTAQPAWADDDKAEDMIADVAAALGERRLDAALALLEKAEAEARSATMRAKVERQRALVLLAAERPADALAALVRARRFDPRLGLGIPKPSRAQETLFACAGVLAADGRSPPTKLARDDLGGWICPPAEAPTTPDAPGEARVAPAPSAAPVPAPVASPPPATTAAPTPSVDAAITEPSVGADDSGVPTLSWVLGGAAVASAAAGGALGAMASSAATDRDPSTSASGLSAGANIAFGAATAALIAGLVVWIAD